MHLLPPPLEGVFDLLGIFGVRLPLAQVVLEGPVAGDHPLEEGGSLVLFLRPGGGRHREDGLGEPDDVDLGHVSFRGGDLGSTRRGQGRQTGRQKSGQRGEYASQLSCVWYRWKAQDEYDMNATPICIREAWCVMISAAG